MPRNPILHGFAILRADGTVDAFIAAAKLGDAVRAALDAMNSFGRPAKVELCVLVDRKPSRELPIQPDFSGKEMDTLTPYKVKVRWKENDGVDDVILLDQ